MAKAQPQQAIRASVLDRLCGASAERATSGAIELRDLKRAVTHDLECLLNTRRWWPGEFPDMEEAPRSLLTYGIPDLSTYSWVSAADIREISRVLEEAIGTFEPRLLARSVKVHVIPKEALDDFRVHLRIDAILHVEPFTEPVSFDTDIEVDTGSVRVKAAS